MRNSCAKKFSAAFIALIAFVFLSSITASAKPEYTLAMYNPGMSTTDNGQMKSIISEMGKIISNKADFKLTTKLFISEDEFNKAVQKDEIDFFYTTSRERAVHAISKLGFNVLLGVSFLGKPSQKYCFYSDPSKKVESIDDLKNSTIIMGVYEEDYYICRKMVGVDPIEYFHKIDDAANLLSAIYAMKMTNYDAAFVADQAILTLKATNPGPVKNIKEIACSEEFMHIPFMNSKKVPAEVAGEFKSIVMNMHKDKDFKTYWPLMKTFKTRFTEVSISDYKSMFDLFELAGNKGWKKGFDKLQKYAKKNRE